MKEWTKQRRMTSRILVVVIILVYFGSPFFVFTHLSHDCTGNDCPVCVEIDACIVVIQLLTEAIGTAAVILFAYRNFIKSLIRAWCGLFLCPDSLVGLKIRLNN
ncbi:AraC family transcriptional regulator [Clostridium sp. E02]|uniref:AraC family transcriptional regulator n=1 Tax=Clostridium sp. E02 TaxID=2487134 RepID=UPI000F5273AA|nr:AraC family transcriptional regulator [Clostridium sp. E02]